MSMLKKSCFLFFLLLKCLGASVEQFVYKDDVTKCCKPEEILVSSDEAFPYRCVANVNRTLNLVTKTFLLNFQNKSFLTSCVDVIEEEQGTQGKVVQISSDLSKTYLDLDYFPKCCPINSVYDMLGHKCVTINNTTNSNFVSLMEEIVSKHISKTLFLIQAGLSECTTVIADYELLRLNELNFDENKGMLFKMLNETVSYANYCVDKVYNSQTYVVRVCHKDFSICKKKTKEKDKIKCIRKCCPDAKILKGGKCVCDFRHGMEFRNVSRVRNAEDPFAIVQEPLCDTLFLVEEEEEYYLNDRGYVVLSLQENPPVFYSPFKPTYCFEHNEGEAQLFLC